MNWTRNASDEWTLTVRKRRLKLRKRGGLWEFYCHPWFAWRPLPASVTDLEEAKAAAIVRVVFELRAMVAELGG
jgi:hypothetical protein